MTPPADLEALLEQVRDEVSFGAFLRALAADFDADRERVAADPARYAYSAGPLGWEIGTISDLLYNAASLAGQRGPSMLPAAENPWQRCAEMLLIAKILE